MLNKAILIGRLVAEPELRQTPTSKSVTSFTLAVNRSYSKGEEKADFIDIVAWGATAEFVCKYFHKGQQVAIEGRIQTRNWEDKQGGKRKSVEVIAEQVHFADSKKSSEAAADAPFEMTQGDAMEGFLPYEGGELPF